MPNNISRNKTTPAPMPMLVPKFDVSCDSPVASIIENKIMKHFKLCLIFL